jgi:hypothetical protein
MKTIFISGAHGSGCSLIKSMAVQSHAIDFTVGTCHESWNYEQTIRGDRIIFDHYYSYQYIKQHWNPDILVWVRVNKKNITQLCHRIVMLDFLYTADSSWIQKDWCWTQQKHDRIAGPDWPAYSITITDYPQWCLDEMCQVAYDRSYAWMGENVYSDYTIDSDELFGSAEPVSLSWCLHELGCSIDLNFLKTWQKTNTEIYNQYQSLFSWTPNWVPPEGWPTQTIIAELYD